MCCGDGDRIGDRLHHPVSVLSELCMCCGTVWSWDTENFKAWYDQHRDCTINYTGSSKAVEKTAAEILWTNSVDKHDFRYTTMLSDGDSSTYAHLCALKVYGDDVEIQKEECVNHVAKRLGTALRNLANTMKKTGISRRTWTWQTHTGCQQKADTVFRKGHSQLHR